MGSDPGVADAEVGVPLELVADEVEVVKATELVALPLFLSIFGSSRAPTTTITATSTRRMIFSFFSFSFCLSARCFEATRTRPPYGADVVVPSLEEDVVVVEVVDVDVVEVEVVDVDALEAVTTG